MKKVYCKDCYWVREFRHIMHGYIKECSQDKCFKGDIVERDTPLSRVEVDRTRRVIGIKDLNSHNDCPDFRQATRWEKFKRFFDIREEPR